MAPSSSAITDTSYLFSLLASDGDSKFASDFLEPQLESASASH